MRWWLAVPHDVLTADVHDRSKSLGWLATAWIEALVVHGPGDVQGEPVRHGLEYTGFIVDSYALDSNGRRLYDSVFLSRPKGCDKSGMAARLALFEGMGPSRFDRWARGGEQYRDPWGIGFVYTYQPGEPIGRPVKSPVIRCMATEEGQSGNTYDTIYINCTEGPLAAAMPSKSSAGLSRIALPGGGEIIPSSASGASKDGGKETFVVFDETHLYDKPELRNMYKVVSRNLRKRKKIAETWMLETTTMFEPGADSVAEKTYEVADLIRKGKFKSQRQLLDHRFGEILPADMHDEEKLRAALKDSYGDALEWNDLDGLVNEVLDPRSDIASSIRYFLNDKSSAENAWIADYEWARCGPIDGDAESFKHVQPKDVIVLGFDGSRKRKKGVTDATALIGCRVSDGCLFEIEVWEQPPGKHEGGWEVPTAAVDAKILETFQKYTVVGFYADPALWETYVAKWEAKYGKHLTVKSTQQHPIEWWMTGNRALKTVEALRKFQDAVLDGELCHDGSPTLTQHVINARRVATTRGVQIRKEHPDSPRKIDAAVAAVLAWQARLDAVAKGIGARKKKRIVRKIR